MATSNSSSPLGGNWQKPVAAGAVVMAVIVLVLLLFPDLGGGVDDASGSVALVTATQEIAANRDRLRQLYPRHAATLERLTELQAQDETPTVQEALSRALPPEGLQLPRLDAMAWEAAQLTGATEEMDLGTAALLSQVYRAQERGVDRAAERLRDRLYTHATFDAERREASLQLLQLLFSELVAEEIELLQLYAAALERLPDVVEEPATADTTRGS